MQENRSLSREKYRICDFSRSNQMPYTDKITKMAPVVWSLSHHLIQVQWIGEKMGFRKGWAGSGHLVGTL